MGLRRASAQVVFCTALATSACTAPVGGGTAPPPLVGCGPTGATVTVGGVPVAGIRAWQEGVRIVPADLTGRDSGSLWYGSTPDPRLPSAGKQPLAPLTPVPAPLSATTAGVPLQVPPGQITFTCLDRSGVTLGSPTTVAVSDPDSLWVDPAWEALGCVPGTALVSAGPHRVGVGPTAAAAAADLVRTLSDTGWVSQPVRMRAGYPEGQPEFWLLSHRDAAMPARIVTVTRSRPSTVTSAPEYTAGVTARCQPIPGRTAGGSTDLVYLEAGRLAETLAGSTLDDAKGTVDRYGFTARVIRPGRPTVSEERLSRRINLVVNERNVVVRAYPG